MKNVRPDGQSLRALLETALAKSLGAQPEPAASAPAPLPPASSTPSPGVGEPIASGSTSGSRAADSRAAGSPVVVGEVVDTHHPHLPGRVHVRWWASADAERSEWLHHERHLTLTRGDRVLLTLPLGWPEWLVTGALGRTPAALASNASTPAADTAASAGQPAALDANPPEGNARLQLEPGQALVIIGHDGEPLLQLRQGPDALRLELVRDQIEINARRRLRLSADSVEIVAGPGGVDVRTDGDAVTRARAIRLN